MAAKTQEPPILLLIDLQHGLVEGPHEWGPRSTPDLVENVTHLLSTWRSKGWPILHVHHDDIDDPTNPISSNFPETVKPHEIAAPQGDEKVFVKHTGSAFMESKLPDTIKSYGHRKIVVIGMDGGQCVNSTTRQGADLGYDMVVVGDACASYGAPDWKNPDKTANAEDTHDVAMSLLTGYGKVTTTKELLGVLGY